MSQTIKRDLLQELGELHYGRKRVQPCSREIRGFYKEAAEVLKDELVTFTPREIELIAQAFSCVILEKGYTCYACAIMPDHVHLVIRKHKHLAEEMIQHFQFASRHELLLERISNHPVWGGKGKVFLDSPEDVRRTIKYVEDNPVKIGRPKQSWDFVTPYDNWPLHKKSRAFSAKPQPNSKTS